MKSGELQRVHKAERNPDKSIIRSAKDHKDIREDLWDTSDQTVLEDAWCAGVFSASFSFAKALAAASTSAADREMLLVPAGGGVAQDTCQRGSGDTSIAEVMHCYKECIVGFGFVCLFVCLFVFKHTWSCFWIKLTGSYYTFQRLCRLLVIKNNFIQNLCKLIKLIKK